MPNKPTLLMALTALLLPLGLASAGCAEEDLETRIIWEDDEHTQALFIPEKVLNSKTVEELPLSDRERSRLRSDLSFWREKPEGRWMPGGRVPDCNPAPRQAEASDPLPSLTDIVSRENGAFLGSVIESVPGYRTKGIFVGQMLYVVATKILRDPGDLLQVGGTYAVPLYHGSITMRGTVLCQEPLADRDFPHVGDQVLVVGPPNPSDPVLIFDGSAFPLKGGTILRGRYGHRTFSSDMPLAALIAALAAREVHP